jgi:hypothetical protein
MPQLRGIIYYLINYTWVTNGWLYCSTIHSYICRRHHDRTSHHRTMTACLIAPGLTGNSPSYVLIVFWLVCVQATMTAYRQLGQGLYQLKFLVNCNS